MKFFISKMLIGNQFHFQLSASFKPQSKFPAKGAVLEGGEEGVQLGEVGALRGLLALDGFDDGGKFLLEGKRGCRNRKVT